MPMFRLSSEERGDIIADIFNSEFSHLNANLMVPDQRESILNAAAERLHQRGAALCGVAP
jgi:hypothetical protein